MAQVIQEVSVEVIKPNLFHDLVAKQNDCKSRFLKVTFVNDKTPIEIAMGSTVLINVKRQDGESASFEGDVNDDGTVTVPLTAWALEVPGDAFCDITVINGDEKLTSTGFHVDVEKASASGEDIQDDENYDLLITLITDCQETKEKVDAACLEAETAVANCEAATAKANRVVSGGMSTSDDFIVDADGVLNLNIGIYPDQEEALFAVGNGTATAPANAFAVLKDGSAIIQTESDLANGIATVRQVSAAMDYATEQANAALKDAKAYTDEQKTTAVAEANAYADEKKTEAVEAANEDANKLISDLLESLFPIGRIIIEETYIDRTNYLGFEWVLTSCGRMIVGVDLNDTDFNESGKIGGEKTHTLSVDEMPCHSHPVGLNYGDNVNHTVNNGNAGLDWTEAGSIARWDYYGEADIAGYTGKGLPHNNMPPYMTAYIWKRIK